jgi:homocysteine S-methyltransferase
MIITSFSELIRTAPLLLTEGAVIERLRREFTLPLDPEILHAAFIYDPQHRSILTQIYSEYIELLQPTRVPFLVFTSTWRATEERLTPRGLDVHQVNQDNVLFLRGLRNEYPETQNRMYIGGLMGCRGDAYRPEEALSEDEAYSFHRAQAEALMKGGADFLFASTLPALSEALGMARVFSSITSDYILSFVVRPNGTLLDGTSLHEAISTIDTHVDSPPIAYMINCVHPRVFETAVNDPLHSSAFVRNRILGLQANTSAKTPEELDGLLELDTADALPFAQEMDALRTSCGTRLLGGCCGTDARHISALARMVDLGKLDGNT